MEELLPGQLSEANKGRLRTLFCNASDSALVSSYLRQERKFENPAMEMEDRIRSVDIKSLIHDEAKRRLSLKEALGRVEDELHSKHCAAGTCLCSMK